MDDCDYSERLASIARVVDELGGRFAAPADCPQTDTDPTARRPSPSSSSSSSPSPILVDELAQLVGQLQRDLAGAGDDPASGRRPWRSAADAALVEPLPIIANRSGGRRTAGNVNATGPRRAGDDRWSGRVHGVHFARTHEHAVAAVVDMVCDAIDNGRAVVLVATGLHRRWIDDELHQRGAQLGADDLHVLDAAAALSALLVDGTPNRDRFRSVVGTLVADVVAQAPAGVSVYGEMVGLLWERGDFAAAMRLEHFWNELQREVPFSLMCGYLLDRHTSRRDLEPIRRLHSHVM